MSTIRYWDIELKFDELHVENFGISPKNHAQQLTQTNSCKLNFPNFQNECFFIETCVNSIHLWKCSEIAQRVSLQRAEKKKTHIKCIENSIRSAIWTICQIDGVIYVVVFDKSADKFFFLLIKGNNTFRDGCGVLLCLLVLLLLLVLLMSL